MLDLRTIFLSRSRSDNPFLIGCWWNKSDVLNITASNTKTRINITCSFTCPTCSTDAYISLLVTEQDGFMSVSFRSDLQSVVVGSESTLTQMKLTEVTKCSFSLHPISQSRLCGILEKYYYDCWCWKVVDMFTVCESEQGCGSCQLVIKWRCVSFITLKLWPVSNRVCVCVSENIR